jgi:ribosomal protein S17E
LNSVSSKNNENSKCLPERVEGYLTPRASLRQAHTNNLLGKLKRVKNELTREYLLSSKNNENSKCLPERVEGYLTPRASLRQAQTNSSLGKRKILNSISSKNN